MKASDRVKRLADKYARQCGAMPPLDVNDCPDIHVLCYEGGYVDLLKDSPGHDDSEVEMVTIPREEYQRLLDVDLEAMNHAYMTGDDSFVPRGESKRVLDWYARAICSDDKNLDYVDNEPIPRFGERSGPLKLDPIT